MIPIDLSNRVALVCGVARGGIGGATALQLGEAGASVFAVDHTDEALEPTLADLRAAGVPCEGAVIDLTSAEQTDTLIARVVDRFGRLDGVANVAGGTQEDEWMPLERNPTDYFRRTFLLNLEYAFRLCRDAAAHMIATGTRGSLVNVTSVSGQLAAPFHGPYGAAKSGLMALTRTMAVEWAMFGIRANAVAPGATASARIRNRPGRDGLVPPPEAFQGFTQPDELASTITFLLSDLASGISGQAFAVDRAFASNFYPGRIEDKRKSYVGDE